MSKLRWLVVALPAISAACDGRGYPASSGYRSPDAGYNYPSDYYYYSSGHYNNVNTYR